MMASHGKRYASIWEYFNKETSKQDELFRFEITTCEGDVLDLSSGGGDLGLLGETQPTVKADWMQLSQHQCSTCLLRESDDVVWCPAAVSMEVVVNSFCAQRRSHELVLYEYERAGVICRKTGDLQVALGFALFYRLSSSGCPNLALDHWALKYFSPDFTAEGLWFSQWCVNQMLKEISQENGQSLHPKIKCSAAFREVFEHMLHRVREVPRIQTDSIAKALSRVHTITVLAEELSVSMREELIAEIEQTYGIRRVSL